MALLRKSKSGSGSKSGSRSRTGSRTGSRSGSRSGSGSKNKNPLNPNIVYQIAQHTGVNGLAALAGVNRTTRNITKAEYDKLMPNMSLKHTKIELVGKIWYMLREIHDDEDTASTQWPKDIFEYFVIIGTFPEYSVNKTSHNAIYKFNSKRGYWEFMKRLSIENVLGLFSWMNARMLEYFSAQDLIEWHQTFR